MPAVRKASMRRGGVLLAAGTVKGLFFLSSGPGRRGWDLSGPHFPGLGVYAVAYDSRSGRHRLWAGIQSMHWGAELVWTDDFGQTWTRPATPLVRFPESSGASLQNIWQIAPGPEDEPGVLYCGVAPAALFVSRDAGASWALNEGLWTHPHRARWTPGFGGLCLHTILPDPSTRGRLTVAISTGGVYRSQDGGASWQVSNRGVRADFLPNKHPEFGQCVHKIAHNSSRPERLYLQNHWGLYVSDDAGLSWRDIARGVPSDFGFCMAVHPRDPETAFIVPLHSDGFRCTPEGRLRVYRTRNGGRIWKPLGKGLPQKQAWETVLRDGLCVDSLDPAGVYFGTRSGKIFASRDEGASWTRIAEGLPAVTCVKVAAAAAVAGAARAPQRRQRVA
ncbi:MAG TPA: exo-alpha-sialidase [Thermoanaerobaculia bacterium]|nr:exo-alpha-sialidase [Thermoanaerobaculia bacterium]